MREINQEVYEKAIKLLSIRMHTTGELHQKLKQRGFSDLDIRPVLLELEQHRFLDDQRFAEIFVDNLKRYKDFGFFGIKVKLLARKIPSDMAEQALQEFFTIDDELAVAARLLKKNKKLANSRDWKKSAAALQRRGFRSDVIGKALKDF